MKIAIQCDFDGTITEEDVSYLILDTYVGSQWKELLKDYTEGRMSVGAFNTKVFAMVKADRQTLVDLVLNSDRVRIRPGFNELLSYCSRNDFKFIIVSNGLTFYIEAILENLGVNGVEVFAAQSQFRPEGMAVKYIGPDGCQMETGLKEAHTELLKRNGYRIVYLGNGVSDIYSARQANHIFATGDLLERCREEKIDCTPFNDLNDVVRGLEALALG